MFSRKSIGVSLTPSRVSFAQVVGTAASPRLEGATFRPFSTGTMRLSFREPNILNPQGFIAALKEARNALSCRGKSVSLSLPDTVGRVMLLDMEGRFKSRSEALDLIRWKLKKKLPFEISDIHLDYQQIKTRENGDMVLLVALVLRPVITQYEELLESAGMVPARIDFNSFNLCNVFERRIGARDDFALVSYYESNLGILFFADGRPEFVRNKIVHGDEDLYERLHKEIRCTFLSYREHNHEREAGTVFCFAPPSMARNFCGITSEATGCDPILLETKTALEIREGTSGDPEFLFPFTAAIGAALKAL